MTQWTPIWTFRTKQFTVLFSVAPEDMDPADSFEFPEDIEAVRNGDVDWFVARVQVLRNGHEIGSDYLGGCAYESPQQFAQEHIKGAAYAREMRAKGFICGSYFPDMVRQAVADARRTLNS